MKVLVGLDVDSALGHTLEISLSGEKKSNSEIADSFFESLSKGLNTEEMDIEELYLQVDFFVEMIKKERLLIRKTAEPNHAKLYIFKIKEDFPDIISRINGFPGRIKTAKSYSKDELIVFRKKGLGVFVHSIENMEDEKTDVRIKSFEDALDSVRCAQDEKNSN